MTITEILLLILAVILALLWGFVLAGGMWVSQNAWMMQRRLLWLPIVSHCPSCAGSGYRGEDSCANCGGTGLQRR